MSMRSVSPGIDINRVDTTRAYPLGAFAEMYNETYSQWFTYIYVQNNSAVAWSMTVGNMVGRNAGATNYTCELVPAGSHPVRVAGYVQGPWVNAAGATLTTVPITTFVWALREGVGEVVADGTVAANAAIIPGGTDGQAAVVAAVTDAAFDWSTEIDAGAGSTTTCRVSCIG